VLRRIPGRGDYVNRTQNTRRVKLCPRGPEVRFWEAAHRVKAPPTFRTGILARTALHTCNPAGLTRRGRSGKHARFGASILGLARYHSRRLLAGVCYNLYKETGDLESFDDAIAQETGAMEAWAQFVAAAGDVYSENLAFGAHAVGFSRHWKEEQQLLARNFEQLMAERQKAVAKPGAKHYALHAVGDAPGATLLPAKGLAVTARVEAPAGVKWVRLRYRHATQYEDYQTAEMTLDAKTGLYTGSIPASFEACHTSPIPPAPKGERIS
jgi:hypothetical protein